MLELYVNPLVRDQINNVTLDGDEFKYRVYWNSFYNRWYMDWYDISGTALSTGTKITVGQGLIKSRLFKGSIVVTSINSNTAPPGLGELGNRVKLIYITEEEYGTEIQRRPLDVE